MPKFTVILQTSPTNDPGGFVNSLPPIKNPTMPLASGDTVSEPWFMEVASVGEVNALIQKQLEALTTRVAALEAKLNELSPKTEPSKPQQPNGEVAKRSEGQHADQPKAAGQSKVADDRAKPATDQSKSSHHVKGDEAAKDYESSEKAPKAAVPQPQASPSKPKS